MYFLSAPKTMLCLYNVFYMRYSSIIGINYELFNKVPCKYRTCLQYKAHCLIVLTVKQITFLLVNEL